MSDMGPKRCDQCSDDQRLCDGDLQTGPDAGRTIPSSSVVRSSAPPMICSCFLDFEIVEISQFEIGETALGFLDIRHRAYAERYPAIALQGR